MARFVARLSVLRVTLPPCPRSRRATFSRCPAGLSGFPYTAGVDPLTQEQIRLRATAKDKRLAQIERGRLLKEAAEGRTPETGATMAKLLDEYAPIADWDVSTRQTNEGFIRRTIKPALGPLEVRKVRGPILDKLYTRAEAL